jgi:hypothetical protein
MSFRTRRLPSGGVRNPGRKEKRKQSRIGRATIQISGMIPNITIHISGSALAIYGAVLSTITACVQVITHYKDRAHLKITVQHNMEMVGDPRYANTDLTIMKVVNIGRRPLTITGVGAYRLSPHNPFVMTDTRPACPCELTEGKQLTVIVDQSDLDLSQMESWEAYTSTGRDYRLSIIPWYRRWLNRRRLIKHAIDKAKGKKFDSIGSKER